jgi:predicted acetyltransferase
MKQKAAVLFALSWKVLNIEKKKEKRSQLNTWQHIINTGILTENCQRKKSEENYFLSIKTY